MVFQPFLGAPVDGVGCYPSQPKLSDVTDRGSLEGSRKERETYMLQRAGTVVLPDLKIEWFDLTSETLRTKTLKGIEFSVAAAPEIDAAAHRGSSSPGQRRLWGALLIGGIGILVWALRPHLVSFYRHRHQQYKDSEIAHFRGFRRACRRTDSLAIWNSLMSWLDRTDETRTLIRLDQFLATHGDEMARHQADKLLAAVSSRAPWNGRDLSLAMARARTHHRHQQSVRRRTDRLLPPLNP